MAKHSSQCSELPYSPACWRSSLVDGPSQLKLLATGKGNAKKPQMQAAAKARWRKDLSEDEADAAWAGAYALDCNLLG